MEKQSIRRTTISNSGPVHTCELVQLHHRCLCCLGCLPVARVSLLLEGVPIERVSILLGHSSIKVTERHYAPWIRERPEQAEADVRRTWAHDPLAILESKAERTIRQ